MPPTSNVFFGFATPARAPGLARAAALLALLLLTACGDERGEPPASAEPDASMSSAGANDALGASGASGAKAVAADADAPPELRAARAAARGANLLLITVDTLRADRLGCYGHELARTPVIDRLALAGVRFERCLSATPVTLPSHTTLMTGLHPFEHGVRDNGLFRAEPELSTLAERLRGEGWNTGAFVSARVLAARYGLAQGFAAYDDDFGVDELGTLVERSADQTVERAIAWLRATPEERPWFAWVHLFEPHAPYVAHEELAPNASASERYDSELSFVDAQLGRLFATLDLLGHADSTLIVLTADHGESLGDHHELTHGLFVYDSTQHVPLLLRGPGLPAGDVISGQVAGVDLAPTCLDLLGVTPSGPLSGRSLLPAMLGLDAGEPPVAYLETETSFHGFGLAPLAGLSTPAYKYIAAPRPELYDLQLDPGETRDLFGTRQDVARDFARQLEALRGPVRAPSLSEPDALSDEERVQLEALGYVFGGSERVTLADPKDVVEQASALRGRISTHMARGEFAQVLELSGDLLALFPGDASAMWAQGQALLSAGRVDDAVSVLEQAVRLRSDRPEPAVDLAHALRLAGDSDAALDAYDIALLADPRHVMALLEGAQLAFETDQLQRSVDYAERALATGLLPPEIEAQTRQSAQAIAALMR